MENSYIERYQVKNLQLEAQLKNERNSLERLSESKKNEQQLLYHSQNRFSEIKKQVLLSRIASQNPKETLIKTKSLLEKLSKESTNLRSKERKLSVLNSNLEACIKHLKDLEARQQVITNSLKTLKLKKQLALDSKQNEELIESRYINDLQLKDTQLQSESLKRESLEQPAIVDGFSAQFDNSTIINHIERTNSETVYSGVVNSDAGQGQSKHATSESDNNRQGNKRDSRSVSYQEHSHTISNANEHQYEKNSQSITIEYVNQSGHSFDIQITGQGQQWVEVNIDPKECCDLKVLRHAKAEIVRSLQAKGLKVSSLILGNFVQEGGR